MMIIYNMLSIILIKSINKDKDIKKIVQEVVNKALEERKTERGEA
mgnify:CR=1 FL=1